MMICKGYKWDSKHKERNVPCESRATHGNYCGNHTPEREKARPAELEQARASKKEKDRNRDNTKPKVTLTREVATMKIRIYDLETRIANQDQQIFVLTNKLNDLSMKTERRNTL